MQELLEIDFSNSNELCRIMEQYGKIKFRMSGKNDLGEDQQISIHPTEICVVTMQSNGWIRQNTYYSDGTTDETFDGKWK